MVRPTASISTGIDTLCSESASLPFSFLFIRIPGIPSTNPR